jgi:ribonuclease HI
MAWKHAMFKGKKVWAQVDESGEMLSAGGRTPIRYSPAAGAKIYKASSSNLKAVDGAVSELPDGADAPKGGGRSSRASSGLGSAKTRTASQRVRAVQVAKDLVEGFPSESIVFFTDGSCRGNPGPAGSGVVMRLPSGEIRTRSEYLGTGTNNVAELTAISIAMDMLEDTVEEGPVQILTDSKYSHGVLALNWKAKANAELIKSIRRQLREHGNVHLHWVAGHAGIPENEQADELANMAIRGRS